MNTKTLIASTAMALLGTGAFASEVQQYPTPSTLTRAEVIAEMNRAQAAGELTSLASSYDVEMPAFASARDAATDGTQLSRIEVRRQISSADYETNLRGEAYGTVQPGLSLRSRAEVRAEAIAAASRFVAGDAYQAE